MLNGQIAAALQCEVKVIGGISLSRHLRFALPVSAGWPSAEGALDIGVGGELFSRLRVLSPRQVRRAVRGRKAAGPWPECAPAKSKN